jgi:hypothetical protein
VITLDTGRFLAASASKVREDSTLHAGASNKAAQITTKALMLIWFDNYVEHQKNLEPEQLEPRPEYKSWRTGNFNLVWASEVQLRLGRRLKDEMMLRQ